MMEEVPRTRCAFVVCRSRVRGVSHLLLVNDERWGDLTFVGGHEEDGDEHNLEKTARRETLEELGPVCGSAAFRLMPLGEEVDFGPTWSKSAGKVKSYRLRFFGIRFDERPDIKEGPNEAGFVLRWVKEAELKREPKLSNIVKVFLNDFGSKLDQIPLSWNAQDEHDATFFGDRGKTRQIWAR